MIDMLFVLDINMVLNIINLFLGIVVLENSVFFIILYILEKMDVNSLDMYMWIYFISLGGFVYFVVDSCMYFIYLF